MNSLVADYPLTMGIIFILAGIAVLIYTKKFPQKKNSSIAEDFRGYGGGTLFIIMGIIIIFRTLFR